MLNPDSKPHAAYTLWLFLQSTMKYSMKFSIRFVLLFCFISLLFTQCENQESSDLSVPPKDALQDSLTEIPFQKVDVELMYRFEGEAFPERAKYLFSSYYSATASRQNTTNFYDERSSEFMRYPATSQNLTKFYEPGFFKKHKPMIVAVYPQGQDTIVKLNFIRVDSLSVGTNMATINFGVTEKGGYLFLTNMVLLNSKDWVNNEFGHITYIYPPTHQFSKEKAAKMEDFSQEMATLFEIEPIQFRYFVTNSNIELYRLWGFDYAYDMFNMDTTGGSAAIYSKIIYSGNGTEYYPHELVHLYVSQWLGAEHSKSHVWFNEGLATYLGGSRGKSLEWQLAVLKTYLNSEPKPDLSNLFKLKMKIGISTNMDYAIGGLICKLAYEKGGIRALKELLTVGKSNDDFYRGIEMVLGVSKEDFPDFIYREMQKYGE